MFAFARAARLPASRFSFSMTRRSSALFCSRICFNFLRSKPALANADMTISLTARSLLSRRGGVARTVWNGLACRGRVFSAADNARSSCALLIFGMDHLFA
jgi:hypothetical protein